MKNNAQSVKEVQAAMNAWAEALIHKDVEAMHKDYANKYCLFDVMETVRSVDGSKELWRKCFPYFDKPIIEYKDMVIHASNDMAVVYFRNRLTGLIGAMPDFMENIWLRGTVCFQKVDGVWQCIHEHCSFPVNCETGNIAQA